MTIDEQKELSRRLSCAQEIREKVIALEDLIISAKGSTPIKIHATLPGAIYSLTEEEQDQFIEWAKEKIKKLIQQFNEL